MLLGATRRKRQESKDGARAQPPQVLPLEGRDGGKVYLDAADASGDDDGDDGAKPVRLTNKLPFQYKGDVFSQRGSYPEASLYMSRLSPPRSMPRSRLRSGGGSSYKMQVKLAPMSQPASLPHRQDLKAEPPAGSILGAPAASTHGSGASVSSGSTNNAAKPGRKQQYALALAAMAENPALHASLLSDSAILASIVSLGRTKDVVTLGACVTTLGHLSRQQEGRVAILNHNAFALLLGLSLTLNIVHQHIDEQSGNAMVLRDCLATLANLTIEDGLEAGFVKEKGLESLLRHRKSSAFVENMCTMAVLNLSCPSYSYPRVDDVAAAVVEMVGRDRAYCESGSEQTTMVRLSRALYNLSSVKTNHNKLVEPDAIFTLQLMISQRQSWEVRRNALAALWQLAAGSNLCRRSIVRSCTSSSGGNNCIAAVVDQLRRQDWALPTDLEDLLCVTSTLECLTRDEAALELMARVGVLDALAALSMSILPLAPNQSSGLQAVIMRLTALVLSLPTNIGATTERVFQLLVSFTHVVAEEGSAAEASATKSLSRSVLFALASILSWSGDVDTRPMARRSAPRSRTISSDMGPAAASSSVDTIESVDDILDQPGRLESVYQHVAVSAFAPVSPEAYLQVALLYNMSFRYSKLDIAALVFPRLLVIAEQSRSASTTTSCQRQYEILALVGGMVFNLCQEYAVHPMLATPDGLKLLRILMESDQSSSADDEGGSETQRLCLDTVCLLLDGRTIPRAELVQVVHDLFPTVRAISSAHSSRRDIQLRATCGACLSRFATVGECRLFMVQNGVLASLSSLADPTGDDTNSSGECLRHCATTYALLASTASDAHPDIGAALIDGGVVKALTLLADAPEEAVRRLCATVLCNLSTSERSVAAMVKCGALRALLVISCVKSNDPETRRICMKSVLNLLRRQENVPQMCQEGLLWAFGLFFAAAAATAGGNRGASTTTDTEELHTMTGATGSATRDHEMLADAFCALSFYPQTRSGLIKKPTIVASILSMLQQPLPPSSSSLSTTTRRKIVGGLLNLLNETDSADRIDNGAPMLLRLGIVPTLLRLLASLRDSDDIRKDVSDDNAEMHALVAQILGIVFQNCAVEAEAEFARPEMIQSIIHLLNTTCRASQRHQWRERCRKHCTVLLYLMSRRDRTRAALVAPVAGIESASDQEDDLWCTLPRVFRAVDAEYSTDSADSARLVMLRCIYNFSCDASMVDETLVARVLPALDVLLPSQSVDQLTQRATIVAGVLRNLSTAAICLEALTSDAATTLLREAFASGPDGAKRDVGLCTCNILLGNINSHELLTRASLLPHVLWMCSDSTDPPHAPRKPSGSTSDTDTIAGANGVSNPSEEDDTAIASAVLRKLATAPGNVTELLDSGVPVHLTSLMRSSATSMYVRANCMASLCLLAQHPDAPPLLASCGVITLALEVLERERARVAEGGERALASASLVCHTQFEAMCLELLSTLAAFASAGDPRERGIASTLFELMEKQEAAASDDITTVPTRSVWRTDRRFLIREEHGDLPPTRISAALRLSAPDVSMLRASLQPFAYQGHSVAFSYSPGYVEIRTIESIVPDLDHLLASDEQEDPTPQQAPKSSRTRGSAEDCEDKSRGELAGRQRRSSRKETPRSRPSEILAEFKPPRMFGKVRTPIVPQSKSTITGNSARESNFDALTSLEVLNSSRASSRGSKSR